MKQLKKSKGLNRIFDYCLIILGAFLIAISTYMFTIPAKFIPGGVTGIASMVENLSGFFASYTIMIINVPILICALIFLERRFAIRSIVGIVFFTGFLELFKLVDLYKFYNSAQPLITALIAGSLNGVGIGLLLRSSSSPGGTEIVGMLIQRKLKHVKIAKILLSINAIIISIGAVMYYYVGKLTLDEIVVITVCSFLQGAINSKAVDMIVNGLHSAVKIEVITSHGKELSAEINKQLEYGVTIIKSQGAFTEGKSDLLICVIPKFQIAKFKEIIANYDPSAFVFLINTREVMGKNFKKNL